MTILDASVRPRSFIDAAEATTLPTIGTLGAWGMLPLGASERASVVMADGPTGRSVYWPEWFSVLDPDLATTDVGFNLVDAVWITRSDLRVRVLIGASAADPSAAETSKSLAETLRGLREATGLPAADVAAMVGVKRRQLYNLLQGGRASAERERWIHTLTAVVATLSDAADGASEQVRAALLRPLADGRSLFDLACAQDEHAVKQAADELAAALRTGRVAGRVRRPSPTLRRRGNRGAASDFLSGYRAPSEDA